MLFEYAAFHPHLPLDLDENVPQCLIKLGINRSNALNVLSSLDVPIKNLISTSIVASNPL